MTEIRTVARALVETGILRRLNQSPATGNDVQRDIGVDTDTYAAASARLWNSAYLRGLQSDGCCNDPCGQACVSAFKQDRVWMLTDYGEAALQRSSRSKHSS